MVSFFIMVLTINLITLSYKVTYGMKKVGIVKIIFSKFSCKLILKF